MNRSQILYCIFTLVITACAQRAVIIPGSNITPEENANANPLTNTITEWTFQPQKETRRYRSQNLTVITASDIRQQRIADTVRLTLHFSLATNDLRSPHSVVAYIDSVETNRNTAYKHLLPFKLIGTLSPTVFNFETEKTTSSCSPQAMTLSGELRPVLVQLPLHIYRDSAWADSTSVTPCAISGLTNVRILREYHVVGQTIYQETPVILIRRKETTHLSQQSAQAQHLVDIRGDGTGVSNIYIEAGTGLLRALEGKYSTKITTVTSGRVTNFIQAINQTIVLMP